jgi:hypothetical protein
LHCCEGERAAEGEERTKDKTSSRLRICEEQMRDEMGEKQRGRKGKREWSDYRTSKGG